jgi:hypothetical protein
MATAAVVSISESNYKSGIAKITFNWTTDSANGAASGTTVNKYTGEIIRLSTVPSAAPDVPTDNYDLTVKDEDGLDVLMGAGADRDEANSEQVLGSSLGAVFDSELTFAVAAAGNLKKGTVHLYIRKY